MRLAALDLLAQARARRGQPRRGGLAVERRVRRARERRCRRSSSSARRCGDAAFAHRRRPRPARRAGARQRVRPRAPAAVRAPSLEALAPADPHAPAACSSGRRRRDRVRRLRRRLQPRAADRRRRALRLDALAARTSAARCPRCGSARARPGSPRRARRSPAPRASTCTRESMEARVRENRAMSHGAARADQIERRTGETDVRLTLTLDGAGAGTRDTGVGLPRPHARPARAPRPHRTWT